MQQRIDDDDQTIAMDEVKIPDSFWQEAAGHLASLAEMLTECECLVSYHDKCLMLNIETGQTMSLICGREECWSADWYGDSEAFEAGAPTFHCDCQVPSTCLNPLAVAICASAALAHFMGREGSL